MAGYGVIELQNDIRIMEQLLPLISATIRTRHGPDSSEIDLLSNEVETVKNLVSTCKRVDQHKYLFTFSGKKVFNTL